MAKCKQCGAKAKWGMILCDACIEVQEAKEREAEEKRRQQINQANLDQPPHSTAPSYGQGAIDVLRVFAWLNLVAGAIIAIYIWSTMASVSVPGRYSTESNPLGIILGIAFLAQGVFGCAFLLVVCSMGENLIAIRKKAEQIDTHDE